MLTVEVLELANWLNRIAMTEGEIVLDEEVSFLESNLSFRLKEYNNETILIRVYFGLENRPEWAIKLRLNQISIDLELSLEDLMAWHDDLIIQLKKFPLRDDFCYPNI